MACAAVIFGGAMAIKGGFKHDEVQASYEETTKEQMFANGASSDQKELAENGQNSPGKEQDQTVAGGSDQVKVNPANSSEVTESNYIKISEIPDMHMLLHLMTQLRASYGEDTYTCDYSEQGQNVINNIVCNPQMICFRDYDIEQPIQFQGNEDMDPRGYLNDQYYGLECRRIPESSVKWIAENILHMDQPSIDAWTQDEDMFYYEDGYYYGFIGGIGSPFYVTETIGAASMGDRYLIYYNYIPDPKYCAGMDTEAMGMKSRGFTVEASYKNIDGHDYWTIYHENELDHISTAEEIYGSEAATYADISGIFDWEQIAEGRHFN